jgi:uncharacterized membrane protein
MRVHFTQETNMTVDQMLNLVLSAGSQVQNHHEELDVQEWRDIADDLRRAARFAEDKADEMEESK